MNTKPGTEILGQVNPFSAEMENEIHSPRQASRSTGFPRDRTLVESIVEISPTWRIFMNALSHASAYQAELVLDETRVAES